MRIIKFIILISFLFNSTAYPYQNISDTLRSNLMTDEGKGAQRLQDMAAQVILRDTKPPSVGHVEKIADAYNAAKAANYDKAYELLMEGLLGEDYVVNIETAIGVLRALQAHYGIDTQKGKELGGILEIVAKHKTVRDQVKMKTELRQFQDSLKVAEAKTKKFSIHNYRPGWTFEGWKEAKTAIYRRFTSTTERKEALKLVKNLAIRLADKGINPGYTLKDGIPRIANAAKNIDELRDICDILFDVNIKAARKKIDDLYGDTSAIRGEHIVSAIRGEHIAKALELKKNYGDFSLQPEYHEVVYYRTETVLEYDTSMVESRRPKGLGALDSDSSYRYDPVAGEWTYGDYGDAYYKEVLVEVKEKRLRRVSIYPLTNLTKLTATPVLFVDAEVVKNPAGFKEALKQLRNNEGNVPVVLLTQETKDSIIAKLEGVDLTGVQFRTQAELGLQDLKWGEDERVSLIDGIDNLKCSPLTKPLSDTFKDLQKTRDQV